VIRMAEKYEIIAPGIVAFVKCDANKADFLAASNIPGCDCMLVRIIVFREESKGAKFDRAINWWLTSEGDQIEQEQIERTLTEEGLLRKHPFQETIWRGYANHIPFRLVHLRPKLHSLAHQVLHERFRELPVQRPATNVPLPDKQED